MAAQRGANVVIIARGADGLAAAAARIRADGGRCDTVQADVARREDVRAAIAAVIERHGRFDTFVSNAGLGVYGKLESLSDEDHRALFATNYWGVVHCATEALPHLKAHGGALIATGSIASQMPTPVLSAYAASKHAAKGYIDSLRLELIHEKAPVAISLIQPSGINTPFARHALNLMDAPPKVPPPVYAPDVVARAICHAAERPTRDMIVGGGGRVMTLLARVLPNLADRVSAGAFYASALGSGEPDRAPRGGFRRAGGEGEIYGDRWMRRTSLYTLLRRHPAASAAGALLVAGALGRTLRRR
jgi:short-subunit dehydrogenase